MIHTLDFKTEEKSIELLQISTKQKRKLESTERNVAVKLLDLWNQIGLFSRDINSKLSLYWRSVLDYGGPFLTDISDKPNGRERFLRFVITLKSVITNLKKGKKSTIRELYYQDVSVYNGKQANLTRTLHKLATFSSSSFENGFKVIPTSKSLIYGGPSVQILEEDTNLLDLKFTKEPILIPRINWSKNTVLAGYPEAIIIMEKDSVFSSFCEHLKASQPKTRLIALTGKGYPDTLIRLFLDEITQIVQDIPILAFVDADAHGLCIYETYKQTSELVRKNIQLQGTYILDHIKGCLTLQRRDFKLMISLVHRALEFHEAISMEIKRSTLRRELTRGMLLFKKSEMNTLNEYPIDQLDLNGYISLKIENAIGLQIANSPYIQD